MGWNDKPKRFSFELNLGLQVEMISTRIYLNCGLKWQISVPLDHRIEIYIPTPSSIYKYFENDFYGFEREYTWFIWHCNILYKYVLNIN